MFVRHAVGFVASFSFAACVGAGTPDGTVPTAATGDAAAIVPIASAVVDAAPPLPADVVGFGTIDAPAPACTLALDSISAPSASLRAKWGGASVAGIDGAKATVALLASGAAFVDVTTGAAHVRGFATTEEIGVRARRGLVVGGFLSATPSARLVVTSAADGKATASLPAIRGVTFLTASPPTAEIACADLTLTPAAFDPMGPVPSTKPIRTGALVDRDIPLSVDAKGAAVATLRLPGTAVSVIGAMGNRVRIVASFEDAIVFGWIAAADVSRLVTEADREAAGLRLLGSLGQGSGNNLLGVSAIPTPPAPSAIDELRCATEVRLAADVSGERTFIGTLAPSVVRIVAREDSFARVSLPQATRGALAPVYGATFVVPARDLALCASQPITFDPSAGLRPSPTSPQTSPTKGLVGAIQLGGLSMTAPIPEADRVVRALMPRLRACYNAGLKEDPTQKGRLVIELKIAPTGDVASTSVTANNGISAKVAACIASSMRRMEFTPPGGAGSTLSVPLVMVVQD